MEAFERDYFKYDVCSGAIGNEAVFRKIEMKKEWNVIFLQKCTLGIQESQTNFALI